MKSLEMDVATRDILMPLQAVLLIRDTGIEAFPNNVRNVRRSAFANAARWRDADVAYESSLAAASTCARTA